MTTSRCCAWMAFLALGGPALAASAPSPAAEPVAAPPAAPRLELGRGALALEYADLAFIPAGVAGGRRVVFTGSPLDGRVVALDRFTARAIGELPPPPPGFVLPFILASLGEGRVAVLDPGGLPSPLPLVPANPTIYEYAYDVGPRGAFSAHLTRTISFAGILIGFAENIAVLPGGRYALSDAVLGAIWIVEADGTIHPGVGPRSPDPRDAIPTLRFCQGMPLVTVGGLPFLFTASTFPGVSPLAVRGGTLYYHSSCAQGVYSIPLASLSDGRQPWERAADIRLVSPQPAGVAVEELMGLNFNPFDLADPYLYAGDALQLRLLRIDPRTGRREVIAHDPGLFDFPSSSAFLPPVAGVAPLLVVSNQQERLTLTNAALQQDAPNLPFVITKLVVFGR